MLHYMSYHSTYVTLYTKEVALHHTQKQLHYITLHFIQGAWVIVGDQKVLAGQNIQIMES